MVHVYVNPKPTTLLQVSAQDKATGNTEKITITERMTPEEGERMVREAKEHAEEDAAKKERADRRNSLECEVYRCWRIFECGGTQPRELPTDLNCVPLENCNDHLTTPSIGDEDRAALGKTIQKALDWLDHNQEADTKEYAETQKELVRIAAPIMERAYTAAGCRTAGWEEDDFEDDYFDFEDDYDSCDFEDDFEEDGFEGVCGPADSRSTGVQGL